MSISSPPEPEIGEHRKALAKVYALLIQLIEDKEKQTTLPDNFGEETGRVEAQPTIEMEGCNG
jgi:hypothetical protein